VRKKKGMNGKKKLLGRGIWIPILSVSFLFNLVQYRFEIFYFLFLFA